jgi:uncharacterized protein (TIGR02302 family)
MPRSGDNDLNGPTPSQLLLERRVLLTRLAIVWESLWPAFWPLMLVASLYVISALFGLWDLPAPAARAVGLVLFGLSALAALRPIFRIGWPARETALRRIELQSGIPHRPATSFEDTISFGSNNSQAETLWQAHKARLADEMSRMKAVWPRPGFARRDPFALRVPIAMGLITAFLYAGPTWLGQLASPFSLTAQASTDPVQIDAWITPPDYTTQPPIFLTSPASAWSDKASGLYTIPAGSEFVLRAQGERPVTVGMRPINGAPPDPASSGSDFAMTAPGENIREYRSFISDNRHITVLDGETIVGQWRMEVIQDQPPIIELLDPPQASDAGVLRITYRVSDDYGVIAGEGLVERAPTNNAAASEDRTDHDVFSSPLFDPPRFPLAMPQIRTRDGEAQVYQDLTAHPWAGATVLLRLQAHDDAGQIGESAPVEITLPSRTFTDPLALAIVEQRRKLAIAPDQYAAVGRALDALTIAPDRYIEDMQIYLGIRTARWRLALRQDRNSLISVVDQLWQIALKLENGDLADAEQRLRAAQEALQRALAQNASSEEIAQRVEELRQALNEYLQSLAENAQNNQSGENSDLSQDDALTSEDLARMLDNIENMARNGSRNEAQQLLSQLQDLLENLRTGRMQPQTGQQRQMSQALDELGDMIDQQRQLMDESFRMDQQDTANGQSDTDRDAELGDMQQRQADLQAALEELIEQLNSLNSQSLDEFDDAKGNMGDALNSLGQGQTGQAVEDQGEALQNLRDGAGSLAEQLAQSLAQSGNRQGNQSTDPLGRPRRTNDPDLGMNVKVPDEIDVQRAREILEELRRKFGERDRPRIELDYFERLLKRF